MQENEVFLKYLIDEEIYIIEDMTPVDQGEDREVVDDKHIEGSTGQESKQIPVVQIKTKVASGTEKKEVAYGPTDIDDSSGTDRSTAKEGAKVAGSVSDEVDTADIRRSGAKEETTVVSSASDEDDTADASRSGAKKETAVVSSASDNDDTVAEGNALGKNITTGPGSVSTKNDISDAGGATNIENDSEIISKGEHRESKRYKATTVLLLDYDDQASITTENIDLLTKILQSVNLDLDSVELVFRDEFDKLEVTSFIDCPVVAFLQLIPQHISALFATEKYLINIINGNQFVACDTLNDLNQNRSLKRKLWEQLKLIYGI